MAGSNGTSAISSQSLSYIEGLYDRYLNGDDGVPARWREYFDGLSESGPVRFVTALPVSRSNSVSPRNGG